MKFDIQKAGSAKRISAFLFDIIVLVILASSVAALLSPALKFDSYNTAYANKLDEYSKKYNIDLYLSQEAYGKLDEQGQKDYQDAYQKVFKDISEDQEARKAFGMIISLSLLITSISLLVAFVAMELIVPLCLKDGRTLGKKIFGIALMRTDGVRVTPLMMFVRSILGKYTIETMIPVLMLIMIFFGVIGVTGTIVIGLILLLQVILFFVTRNHSLIHDVLSCTVVVDYDSQRIFDTKEELVEYKAKLEAENAARQDY